MIGILGPNGAGKSTLLRLASGIVRPDAGRIEVNGQPIQVLKAKQRAKFIAYLPQQIPDHVPYTVREYVEMGRFAHQSALGGLSRESRRAVSDAIERLGLESFVRIPLSELSGGERQRVAMARCIAQGSQILLLDEPISNLDLFYQLDILALLDELAHEGYLIVMVMHHLEFAARYCSHLLLLKEGRIHASGTEDHVLTSDAIRDVFGVNVKTFTDPHGSSLRLSFV